VSREKDPGKIKKGGRGKKQNKMVGIGEKKDPLRGGESGLRRGKNRVVTLAKC